VNHDKKAFSWAHPATHAPDARQALTSLEAAPAQPALAREQATAQPA